MRDLYLKRKRLCDISMNLRSLKFEVGMNKEEIDKIIKIQNDAYKRFKFYDNYIKIGGKLKSEILHTKEGWLLSSWHNG